MQLYVHVHVVEPFSALDMAKFIADGCSAGLQYPMPSIAGGIAYRTFADAAGLTHLLVPFLGYFKRQDIYAQPFFLPMVAGIQLLEHEYCYSFQPVAGYTNANNLNSYILYTVLPALTNQDCVNFNAQIAANYVYPDVTFQYVTFASDGLVERNLSFTVGDTQRWFWFRYSDVTGAYTQISRNAVRLPNGHYAISSALSFEGVPSGHGYLSGSGAGSGTCGFDAATKQKIDDIYSEVVPVDFTPLTDKMDEFLLKIDDALLYAEDFKTSLASIPARLAPSDVDNIADRLAPADEDVKEGLTEIKDKIALDNENFKTSFEGRFDQTNLQLSAVVGAICALMSKDKRSVSQLIFDGEYKNADNLVTKNITLDSATINQKLGEIVKTLCRFMSGSANTPDELAFITLGDIIKNADNLRDLAILIQSLKNEETYQYPALQAAIADVLPMLTTVISKLKTEVEQL